MFKFYDPLKRFNPFKDDFIVKVYNILHLLAVFFKSWKKFPLLANINALSAASLAFCFWQNSLAGFSDLWARNHVDLQHAFIIAGIL